MKVWVLKRMHPKGRKIADLDADAEVTLVDEAQERYDDNLIRGKAGRQKKKKDNLFHGNILSYDGGMIMSVAQRTTREEQELKISEGKPPTPNHKRGSYVVTYLKNMANYKHSQLKNKSFEEIKMLFNNTMKWVDSFVPMYIEVVEGSKSQTKGSSKRTGEELKSDNSKKKKIDENVEAEVDDEAEMKKLMEIVPDDEVAIDAIPLAIKPHIMVIRKIIKEGKMGYFQIIRADGSLSRYSSMIRMLQNVACVGIKRLHDDHGVNTAKEEMDLETAQTTTTAKLPILKQGEYDMWRLRIEQYFQVQDYALWDVIENGNSFKPVV
ncbi:hypothetical protein Tco_1005677 [Tanacetum coccineum]|uniref:Uncharacterized protein n=1 Tax=Tanacetum coccineum TaxID=301880 RepID=A0ABQ5FG48_9ASTR